MSRRQIEKLYNALHSPNSKSISFFNVTRKYSSSNYKNVYDLTNEIERISCYLEKDDYCEAGKLLENCCELLENYHSENGVTPEWKNFSDLFIFNAESWISLAGQEGCKTTIHLSSRRDLFRAYIREHYDENTYEQKNTL